jgi:hypothetical protein
MMLLLVHYIDVETGSVLMSKEARMTPLEPNPLSIRHGVGFAQFCEFGMSRVKTADKK